MRERIADFLTKRLTEHDNPRGLGRELQGKDKGRWRWRVGDYRIVGLVEAARVTIVVIRVGHRKTIYR